MIKLGTSESARRLHADRVARLAIGEALASLVAEQYRALNEILIPALEKERIFPAPRRMERGTGRLAAQLFQTELLPVLSPIGLDPAHPFPRILNKSLNFAIDCPARIPSAATSAMPSCRRRARCRG